MPAEGEISTIPPSARGAGQQQNHVTKRSNRRVRTILVVIITMTVLSTGLVLHTICLATTNLANLQTSTGYDRRYHFPFENPPKTDISLGLWKMCSKAWHFDCVKWASTTKVDKDTTTIVSIEKPDWLIVAQYTSVSGLSVAAITELIVVINLCISLYDPSKLCRLFPAVTCIGGLIAGGLVFASCALVITHYDTLPYFIATLEEEAFSATDLMITTSSSTSWGYYMDMASVVVMWMAGLLSLCNHNGPGKSLTRARSPNPNLPLNSIN